MRLLTFQSRTVYDMVSQGDYYAKLGLARERRDYTADVTQLGGYIPVWAFKSVTDEFKPKDFLDGMLFDRFRCEMSLYSSECLEKFLLLELLVPDNIVYPGLTHNAYSGAVVIPYIKKSYLKAVYQLHYVSEFYPVVELVIALSDRTLFYDGFTCRKIKRVAVTY